MPKTIDQGSWKVKLSPYMLWVRKVDAADFVKKILLALTKYGDVRVVSRLFLFLSP